MLNFFNCKKGVSSRFKFRRITFFLLLSILLCLTIPGAVSAQVVDIPDANLRAAIAEALNKAPGDAITRAEMETLVELWATYRDITDLRGIEFAINLTHLYLYNNNISDVSPLASLTNLTELNLRDNDVSDLTPLANLTNLIELDLWGNNVIDLIPLTNLTNLTWLSLGYNDVIDLTPLANLTNLTELYLWDNNVIDLTPLANLTNLTILNLGHMSVSDLTPLANLTNLIELNLNYAAVSDLTPLANLTNLTGLHLWDNQVIDLTPLANLTNLTKLNLKGNQIRDVSPLVGLVNLEWLRLTGNPIEDLSPLAILLARNPGLDVDIFPPIDKITGPWLWMIAPTEPGRGGGASTDVDSLATASGWAVTEADVATNGANIGDKVGNYAWTPAVIADTGGNNINDVVNSIGFAQGDVNHHSSYALISLVSATVQSGVMMKVGSDDSIKVWLNGEVVHTNAVNRGATDFDDTFRVDLVSGDNLLLVKVSERDAAWSMFVGIDADFIVLPPPEPEPDPLDVNGDGQVNIIDLVWVAISYGTRGDGLPADVNADGVVNVQDFAAVAAGVDAANPLPQGMEQVLLEALERALEIEGVAGAPMGFRTPQHALSGGFVYSNVAAALADARLLAEIGDARLSKGVALLETLLELLTKMGAIPETTALLPNYPNPFNPETWIPYQLGAPADVTLHIYSLDGGLVRTLVLGHQPAGMYQSRSRAAHWDGRNALGEPVASGVYFYTLTAGEFTATRKMLIRK